MKRKVLILHQSLSRMENILADERLCAIEPHIVCTLDEALARLQRNHYVLVVVEVIPPWRFSAEPVVIFRETTSVPILALLRGHDADSFRHCLHAAHESVWEPFTADEIIARGSALVEQSVFDPVSDASLESVYCHGLLIDFEIRKVYYQQDEIRLARKEYAILKLLAEHKNHVLSKEQIYTRVWHDDFIENVDGVVSYQIHNVRKRLAQFTDTQYIENVWGEGYRFRDSDSA